MKRSCLAWIALLPLLAAGTARSEPPALPAKKDFLIFLLIGQSNMAGRGKPPEKEDLTPHPRVLVLGKPQTWLPALDPLHWDKPNVAGVGLGTTFGKVVAEALPGKTIGLVPAAFGGSQISEWAKDGKHYGPAVERAGSRSRTARWPASSGIKANRTCNPNGPRSTRPSWISSSRICADLAAADVPFIAGTLSDRLKDEGAAAVNAALLGLPARQSRTGCVEAKRLPLSGDNVHFSAAAYREFGRRYAAEWQRVAGVDKSK